MAGPARAGLVSTASPPCERAPAECTAVTLHTASPAAGLLSPLDAWVCGSRDAAADKGTPRSRSDPPPSVLFLACFKGYPAQLFKK